MFITSPDLSTGLYPEIKNLIARFDEILILNACKVAEREVEDNLTKRYLIRPELEKIGTDRDPLLVMICRDIAIYHLYAPTENLPNKVVKRYEDAIRILEGYASGEKVLTGVPAAPEPPAGTPEALQIGYGGKAPRPTLV